jgi:hypothetical protein
MCQNYSCVCGNHTPRVKSHSACGNCTLRVEINLVRVYITPVSVVITLCVWKLHSACKITLWGLKLHLRVEITLVRVEITLCVWKLDSACRNYTLRIESHYLCINYTRKCHIQMHTCQNYTRGCRNHTLRIKYHCAGRNCTFRVEITLVRV